MLAKSDFKSKMASKLNQTHLKSDEKLFDRMKKHSNSFIFEKKIQMVFIFVLKLVENNKKKKI